MLILKTYEKSEMYMSLIFSPELIFYSGPAPDPRRFSGANVSLFKYNLLMVTISETTLNIDFMNDRNDFESLV